MAKRIMAKVDTYQKDGAEKGKYIEIGVILENNNGEYALINPSTNLAGVLLQQRINLGNTKGSSVMCSIFDNDNQHSAPAQQPSQQPAPATANEPDDGFDEIPFK